MYRSEVLKIVFCCFLLLSSAGCREKAEPLDVEEETMVRVLADIHLAEAASQTLYGGSKDSILRIYYDQVFEIHGIDPADFDSTMLVLREDPVRLERIYTRVMEELNEKSAQVK